jgi:hypothetical protein
MTYVRHCRHFVGFVTRFGILRSGILPLQVSVAAPTLVLPINQLNWHDA